MRRSRKRKTPKKVLITAVIAGLIALILVVTAYVLMTRTTPRPPTTAVQPGGTATTRPAIAGEELIIKGCLYELGIPRDRVRITGRTVHVSLEKALPESGISKITDILEKEDGITVRMKDPSRLEVTMNGHEWDILFLSPRARPEIRSRVAIIIDDLGQDMSMARRLAAIDADLTFAVLPHQQHTADVARFLHKHRREVLLHQPMEGGNGKNPGEGAIYGATDPADAARILQESLDLVPHAVGVNNHMGSVVTQNRPIMEALMTVLKEENLFFIDSLTTGSSVGGSVAEALGVPFEVRDVFLDNDPSGSYITGQIEDLVEQSLRHGEAIGICHPHAATLETLAREVPRLREKGIEVVRVSELVDAAQ